jgi:glutathione S-transferase
MPILHGANLSPYVRKVRVALAFKGIEYDDNQVVPFGPTPEFQALSPLKKIPVYQDGDLVLPDSSVILAYLECAHPTPALLPADAGERGRALWFEEYGDTKVTTNLATVFFQRFVGPRFLNLETDEAAIRDAIDEQLPPVFDYLSEQLGDSLPGRWHVLDRRHRDHDGLRELSHRRRRNRRRALARTRSLCRTRPWAPGLQAHRRGRHSEGLGRESLEQKDTSRERRALEKNEEEPGWRILQARPEC